MVVGIVVAIVSAYSWSMLVADPNAAIVIRQGPIPGSTWMVMTREGQKLAWTTGDARFLVPGTPVVLEELSDPFGPGAATVIRR